jgi:multidrug efflux pump subunit AcrA (membrane-fusion protein)
VFVVRSDGAVEKRSVTTGIETADRVEIRSGVAAGEQVITNNLGSYQPGQKVRAIAASSASTSSAGKGN